MLFGHAEAQQPRLEIHLQLRGVGRPHRDGGGGQDGKSATVTLTGCGEADVTIAGVTESITLDRCVGI
jgi:hypothetical protein